MTRIARKEAAGQLDELLDEVARGEDVVIEREDGRRFRLILEDAAPVRPRFGSARGEVWMSEDFDEPLEDFAEYTE